MAVSLTKENKPKHQAISLAKPETDTAPAPVREYTPVHVMDECETIAKHPVSAIISDPAPAPTAIEKKAEAKAESDIDLKIAEAKTVEKYLKDHPGAEKRIARRFAGSRPSAMPAAIARIIAGFVLVLLGFLIRDRIGWDWGENGIMSMIAENMADTVSRAGVVSAIGIGVANILIGTFGIMRSIIRGPW